MTDDPGQPFPSDDRPPPAGTVLMDGLRFEGFKPGVWLQQYQYKSFSPVPVNRAWLWQDPRINTLLEQATRALGELNAFSMIVPDVDLFIEMHIAKEANQSSRIEGTQTAMDEALMSEEMIAPERRDDWREVRNYIEAMNTAMAVLKNLPLSNRLLRQTHAILMQGVRGEHKMPGEFRNSQNWIGGSGLKDAAFVPPHPNEVPELMSDLEKFCTTRWLRCRTWFASPSATTSSRRFTRSVTATAALAGC